MRRRSSPGQKKFRGKSARERRFVLEVKKGVVIQVGKKGKGKTTTVKGIGQPFFLQQVKKVASKEDQS